MSATITPALKTKIERRARRAFSRFDEGDQSRQHRISSVTKDSLTYRIPRSSKNTVPVVRRDDGTIVVDPPTTGLIDVLVQADMKRLKKHGGAVRAYMLVKAGGNIYYVASTYQQKSDLLRSRAECVEHIKSGDRVFVVETNHDDLTLATYETDAFTARSFKVTAELDHEKDLGFTTGLYDCRTLADVEQLRKRKHLGRVRAYKHVTKDLKSPHQTSTALQYKIGEMVEVKDAVTNEKTDCAAGINLAAPVWCLSHMKKAEHKDDRALAFEFDMEDLAAVPVNTDGKFRVFRALCVEEVDTKDFKPLPPPPMLPALVEPDPAEPTDKRSKSKGKAKPKADPKPKKKRGIIDKLLGRGKDE
jgi:hypothetical protein